MPLNRTTKYGYDIIGRPVTERLIDSTNKTILAQMDILYDDSKNRISGYTVEVDGESKQIDYVYGTGDVSPDLVTSVKLDGTEKLSYTYDGLNRLATRTVGTTTPYTSEYTFLEGATEDKTTTLVKSVKNGNDTLTYTYDELGNITSVSKNGTLVESYTYDNLNQLASVTKGADTYTYTYDAGGNILSVAKNGTTEDTYTYGNSEWKDLLTAYNGQAITYDAIGNPLTYRDGMSFTWTEGRRLSTVTTDMGTTTYQYNEDGLRTSKTFGNGNKVDYYWLDGTLQAEAGPYHRTTYLYDENGSIYGFLYESEELQGYFFYVFNVQGDVIGIINNSGDMVVEYTYDAWGNVTEMTGVLEPTIGQINPIRYRGYYYDEETGLYYVSSRYYDSEIGRWINADGYVSTGQGVLGYNMFAYCGNNPVNRLDYTGQFWSGIWGFVKTAVTQIGKAMGLMSPAYAGCGGAAVADGPLPFGDIVAVAGATLITVGAIGYGIYQAAQAPSISIPKVEEKSEAIVVPKKPDPPVIFPVNPNTFNPVGLVKVPRTGTKNGAFISWMNPLTNTEVFRWDENPNYSNGPHYHIHGTGHYYPGMIVPEPYATIYFPFR